jgi:hypothetical protein
VPDNALIWLERVKSVSITHGPEKVNDFPAVAAAASARPRVVRLDPNQLASISCMEEEDLKVIFPDIAKSRTLGADMSPMLERVCPAAMVMRL